MQTILNPNLADTPQHFHKIVLLLELTTSCQLDIRLVLLLI